MGSGHWTSCVLVFNNPCNLCFRGHRESINDISQIEAGSSPQDVELSAPALDLIQERKYFVTRICNGVKLDELSLPAPPNGKWAGSTTLPDASFEVDLVFHPLGQYLYSVTGAGSDGQARLKVQGFAQRTTQEYRMALQVTSMSSGKSFEYQGHGDTFEFKVIGRWFDEGSPEVTKGEFQISPAPGTLVEVTNPPTDPQTTAPPPYVANPQTTALPAYAPPEFTNHLNF